MSDAPVNSTTIASVRAVLFITCMYMLMAIIGLVGLVPAILSRRACLRIMKSYVTAMRWLLRVICRLHCEIRGPVPDEPCIIAAKHQSFLDVMLLTEILPDPRFVMKRTILYMPLLGYY
ncbi:MAG: 1-acyl-sn-glycerol-3-phosphate acyltransferase, partial [Pseudomonadota bacterium]